MIIPKTDHSSLEFKSSMCATLGVVVLQLFQVLVACDTGHTGHICCLPQDELQISHPMVVFLVQILE